MKTGILTSKAKAASVQNIKEKNYWTAKLSGEWQKNHFPYDNQKAQTGKEAVGTSGISKITLPEPANSKL
ncbi:MAG: hypothetical protein GY757_36690, partial [bacterium]|nr:hypothetical protein [bacterium]